MEIAKEISSERLNGSVHILCNKQECESLFGLLLIGSSLRR